MWGRLTAWILVIVSLTATARAGEDWPQWGGPDRDFTIASRELSRDWGENGPPELWSRPLGGGFASIVSDGKRLYTMYRDGDAEIIVALDPRTGKTKWEHRYDAPIPKTRALSTQYGKGPNSTPLLTDGKLVTLGFTGHVRCVETKKGELVWSYDLGKSFEAETPYFGHAASPLQVGGNALIVAGGLLAFDLDSGEPAWENRDFEGSYGSPRLVDGQIIAPVSGHLAGFDPVTGKTLWSQEHKNQWGTILTSPVIDEAGRIFISAAQVGSILIGADGRQVWQADKTQIAHSNAVRAGKHLFASVGDSASFISATSLEDGSELWRERGFAKANLLRVGDDYLLLDFEGQLAMVELDAQGMEIVTKASINDAPTWTPPTLIGTTLYIRDEERIAALDLSARKK